MILWKGQGRGGCVANQVTARWCFGSARIWRMSTPITWLYKRTELSQSKAREVTWLKNAGTRELCIEEQGMNMDIGDEFSIFVA